MTSIMAQEVTKIDAAFPPLHSFESDSNNGPSPRHSNLMPDGVYVCSCLPNLWFPGGCHICPRAQPDFNNCQEMTRIVAAFRHGVYSSPTQIVAPPQAIPMLNCKHALAANRFAANN